MQLMAYSDSEAQALHLNPFMSSRPVIGPGDDETQPLWLSSPIIRMIPDACHRLEIGAQGPWWLNWGEDLDLALRLAAQAHCEVDVAIAGSEVLEIGAPGLLEIEVETFSDAQAMLRLKGQARVAVDLALNAEEPLQLSPDARQQLWLDDNCSIDLQVKEDGHMELNAEACDER